MKYLEASRASSPRAGVRLRVALDVLDQADRRASSWVAARPRVTVRELRIGDAGEPIVPGFGSPAQLATLLWEILALQVADTDELPWSDPSEDLPPDVLDALASLTVRPALTVPELRDRFSSVLASHASSRGEVARSLREAAPGSFAPIHTPVVPRDPNRITIPAPAKTVQALRTLSATELGLGAPVAAAKPRAAQHAPRPAAPAAALPAAARSKPLPARSPLAGVPAARPAPVSPPNTMPKAELPTPAANPGAITVSMATVALPASARPSERPAPPSTEAAGSVEPSVAVPPSIVATMVDDVSDAGVLIETRGADLESVGPRRGTLEPWAEAASDDGEPSAGPRRRRTWPVVAVSLAAALALIAVASQRPGAKDLVRDLSSTATADAASPPAHAGPPVPAVATDAPATNTASSVATASATVSAKARVAPPAKPPVRLVAPSKNPSSPTSDAASSVIESPPEARATSAPPPVAPPTPGPGPYPD